jgi:hypothetical protein
MFGWLFWRSQDATSWHKCRPPFWWPQPTLDGSWTCDSRQTWRRRREDGQWEYIQAAAEKANRVPVSAAAFVSTIGSDARQRLAASGKDGKYRTPGTWNQVGFLTAQSIEVGITDENQVGFVLDPGMETEFAISIEPQLAWKLGKLLLEIADKARCKDPTVDLVGFKAVS